MLLRKLKNILLLKDMTPSRWLIFLTIFIVLLVPAILNDHNNTNAYLLLADSFLKGHLSLPASGFPYFEKINYADLINFQGKYYLPYPPFPALLIIPFLFVFGSAGVNSVLICVLLSCLNIYLLHTILRRIDINTNSIYFLIYGFIFGTSYWYVLLSSHHVYGFAQIVSVTCTLLLLYELTGKKRIYLLAIYLGLSFLSRQMTIFFAIFVLGYLYYQFQAAMLKDNRQPKTFFKQTFLFCFFLSPFVITYLLYNYYRFGNPFDSGYAHIQFIGILKERVDHYGTFSFHYVLYNFYAAFLKGFNIEFTGHGLLHIKDMDLFGTSLLSASPFLVCALKTGWSKILRISAWITVCVILAGLLFYHNNGYEQVNAYRFSLDFLPMLIILTALGAKNIPQWLFKGMVTYSIVLNLIAVGIHFLYHTI